MHGRGMNNVVADALSQLLVKTAEEEVSTDAFANKFVNQEDEFPEGCPLSCQCWHKELACWQKKDQTLQNKFRTQP